MEAAAIDLFIMMLGAIYIFAWVSIITLVIGMIIMFLLTHLGFFVTVLTYGGIFLGLIALTIIIFISYV
jgi:hypothetical protein